MEEDLEKMLEEIKERLENSEKMLEEIEERLENLEKKIDWLIEYLGLGMYNREIKITPAIGTEEKEHIKYYREPTSTDGR